MLARTLYPITTEEVLAEICSIVNQHYSRWIDADARKHLGHSDWSEKSKVFHSDLPNLEPLVRKYIPGSYSANVGECISKGLDWFNANKLKEAHYWVHLGYTFHRIEMDQDN